VFKKATIALVSALLLLPTLASAKDMTGKFGLGYYMTDAPVGIRYWVTPKVGLDLGVGYELKDLGSENASSYWFDLGIPYIVVGTERANFFVRLGATIGILDNKAYYQMTDANGVIDKTWSDVNVSLAPGAEVFVGDNFSLEASHGINFQFLSPPEGDSLFNVKTFGNSITTIGFHFYF
jgi:hypothetical protein